jgi:hypothetical protein
VTELWRDSCDAFATKGWFASGGSPLIGTGRTGNGFQITGSTDGLMVPIPAWAESDTLTYGFAYRAVSSLPAGLRIVELYSDQGVTLHNRLNVAGTGGLAVTRSATTLATSADGLLAVGVWAYIEIQIKLADAPNGFVIVRVNGTEVINATGLDTKNGGTKTTYDAIRITRAASTTSFYDDMYVKTGAGETFNGDLGALTTTPTASRLARHSVRVVTSPYIAAGVAVARHAVRVAIDPLTPEPSGGSVKTWTGSAFVDSPVKVWNGSAFVDAAAVKTWNGSAFV